MKWELKNLYTGIVFEFPDTKALFLWVRGRLGGEKNGD